MKILETIAQSLRTQRIHPTQVLNALTELENAGGITTIGELEYRLNRLVQSMTARNDNGIKVAEAWLNATRAYLKDAQTADAQAVDGVSQGWVHASH